MQPALVIRFLSQFLVMRLMAVMHRLTLIWQRVEVTSQLAEIVFLEGETEKTIAALVPASSNTPPFRIDLVLSNPSNEATVSGNPTLTILVDDYSSVQGTFSTVPPLISSVAKRRQHNSPPRIQIGVPRIRCDLNLEQSRRVVFLQWHIGCSVNAVPFSAT